MKSYLVNKHDFFGPQPHGNTTPARWMPHTTFDAFPEDICACIYCLFDDLRAASFINRRAIENGRRITDAAAE